MAGKGSIVRVERTFILNRKDWFCQYIFYCSNWLWNDFCYYGYIAINQWSLFVWLRFWLLLSLMLLLLLLNAKMDAARAVVMRRGAWILKFFRKNYPVIEVRLSNNRGIGNAEYNCKAYDYKFIRDDGSMGEWSQSKLNSPARKIIEVACSM